MEVWLTSQELEALQLSGLPTTGRRIREMAKRQNWPWRPRKASGGGREHPLQALPAEAQAEYLRRHAEELYRHNHATLPGSRTPFAAPGPIPVGKEPAPGPVIMAPDTRPEPVLRQVDEEAARRVIGGDPRYVREAEAWRWVFRAWEGWRKTSGYGALTPASERFAWVYKAGEIEVPASVREAVRSFSGSTLRKRLKAEEEQAFSGTVRKYHRGAAGIIEQDSELRDLLEVTTLKQWPHIDAGKLRDAARARFKDQPERVPQSERTFGRWLKGFAEDNRQRLLLHSNPDQHRSVFGVATGDASEDVVDVNQIWEADGTKADVMLADGRHCIVGIIDVYSRVARLLVTKTQRGAAVGALLRRCILDWGKPALFKTDNGADYTGRYLVGVLDALQIDQKLCIPFTPDGKPHIERFFETFSHDLLEMMGNFIGHNVTDRKGIESKRSFADRLMKKRPDGEIEVVEMKMTAADLQKFCDKWCENRYAHRPHKGLHDLSPYQVSQGWQGERVRLSPEREHLLDLVLMEGLPGNATRVPGKRGIRIDNAFYDDPALIPYRDIPVLPLPDPTDAGFVIVLEADTKKWICRAECPQRRGKSPAELAARMDAAEAQWKREARQDLRERKKRVRPEDLVDEIMAYDEENAAKERAKLVDMRPQSYIEMESKGLTAAATVAEGLAALEAAPVPHDPEAMAQAEESFARAEERRAEAAAYEDPNDRFSRLFWDDYEERPIGDKDRAWMEHFAGLRMNDLFIWGLNETRKQKVENRERQKALIAQKEDQ